MNSTAVEDIFTASAADGQDKRPHTRSSAASAQPYTAAAPSVDRKQQRKKHGSEKRQTLAIYSRVKPHVKYGLRQLAKARGKKWTESRIIAEACEAYLENDLGEKFGVRLSAHVTNAIHWGLQKHSDREASMAFKAYYSAEQARNLMIEVLRYLLIIESGNIEGEENALAELPLIIANAQTEALKNMKHDVKADNKQQ
jgi:hypothetical protein